MSFYDLVLKKNNFLIHFVVSSRLLKFSLVEKIRQFDARVGKFNVIMSMPLKFLGKILIEGFLPRFRKF